VTEDEPFPNVSRHTHQGVDASGRREGRPLELEEVSQDRFRTALSVAARDANDVRPDDLHPVCGIGLVTALHVFLVRCEAGVGRDEH
jgi:hypothetical protein